jgi:V8-like Glu-specific endopeptidase
MRLKRADLNGNFVQKRDKYILVHSMPTLGGHSGSPIVRVTDKYNKESIKVVGIHTHKGTNDTNEGLIMTQKMKQKILKYAKELSHQH